MLPAKPLTQQLFAESIEIHRDLDTGRLSQASHALRIPHTRHARQLLRALTSVSDLDTDARARGHGAQLEAGVVAVRSARQRESRHHHPKLRHNGTEVIG